MAAPTAGNESYNGVYPIAIAFAFLNLLVTILILPPLFWHFRNRNVGATVLVTLTIYACFQNFLNAVIWPNDDMPRWYNGVGLCDIEVNIQVAAQVGFPVSMASILKALARVMDTEKAVIRQTPAQRKRAHVIDLLLCVGVPMLQILFLYIVRTWRFYLWGIAGCQAAVSDTWLTFVLIPLPPLLWTLVDVYYAALVLFRLIRYRMAFESILANSNTNKSRFLRLYGLCVVCILGWFPIELYIVHENTLAPLGHYSWHEVHNSTMNNDMVLVRSEGTIVYDRWIWLSGGVIIFLFFGFGRDAVAMYRSMLLSMGMERVFPSLKPDHRNTSNASAVSSFGSKIKFLFTRKSSIGSYGNNSRSSHSGSAVSSEISNDKMTFVDSFNADSGLIQRRDSRQTVKQTSVFGRLTSLFKWKPASKDQPDHLPLAPTGVQSTVRSNVTGGRQNSPIHASQPHSPGTESVMVRKEVKQASETAESITDAHEITRQA